jgi:phosphate:Na+ symporter
MLKGIMPAIIKGDTKALEEIRKMDDTVDILHAGILDYLAKISRQPLLEEQTKELMQLMEAVSNLENIGDIVETNLVVLGHDRVQATRFTSANRPRKYSMASRWQSTRLLRPR